MSASLVAEKLKRRREPIEPDEPPPPPKKPASSFAAGDTVLGNFKGFGDWDEALIVGVGADGTYTLEYVDEGLIEEGVPASNIKAADGAIWCMVCSHGAEPVACLRAAADAPS